MKLSCDIVSDKYNVTLTRNPGNFELLSLHYIIKINDNHLNLCLL